ncbi:hypothetical protein [Xenophilus sp. Marseille-Q4582]|uniref:hypothetical protein n=1 Tax=Xenophilus sp. Marseille-Q4582 TaxID=2866600 RepID=UPI001CE46C2E|nr:hypothetical protein [Xenophilus sp. Marseille-Q4582]
MKSDDWKFPNWPKNRGGFDGLGRAKAQTLDDIGLPYAKKRPRPGVLAEKKGDFLYVTLEQQPAAPVTLRLLTVGRINLDPRTPALRVWGADSITGAWTDRGPAPAIKIDTGTSQPNGGWRSRTNPPGYPEYWELLYDNNYTIGDQHMSQLNGVHLPLQLHAYGRGRAMFTAYKQTQYHFINVFLGSQTVEMTRTAHLTTDGRAFEALRDVSYARAAFNPSTGSFGQDGTDAWYTPGTRVGEDGQWLNLTGVIGYAGTRFARCLRDDGETVTAHPIVGTNYETRNTVLLGFFRIGPAWLIAIVGVHRHVDAMPTIAAEIVIRHSVDAGVTWLTVNAADAPMFAPAFGAIAGISTGTANNRFLGFTFQAVPLSATKAVILANLPTKGVGGAASYNEVHVGIFDRTAGTITSISKLATTDPSDPDLTISVSRSVLVRALQPGLVAMGPGVALFTSKPRGATESGWDFYYEPSRVLFIERSNPGVLVDLGSMPLAPHLTGIPTATGPNTLACTMYTGGAYRVFQGTLQRDPITGAVTGLEWAERGVITADAPPPEDINGMAYNAARYGTPALYGNDPVFNVLPEFTTLLPLRSDGNTTPGVPWASDSRIAAPE